MALSEEDVGWLEAMILSDTRSRFEMDSINPLLPGYFGPSLTMSLGGGNVRTEDEVQDAVNRSVDTVVDHLSKGRLTGKQINDIEFALPKAKSAGALGRAIGKPSQMAVGLVTHG